MNLLVNNNKTDFNSTEKVPPLHVLRYQKHFTYSIRIRHCCHTNFVENTKGPSIKDVRTKLRKIDPSPLVRADTP